MAAVNTTPIYPKVGDIQACTALIATAATVPHDGSGTIATDVYKCFTADATNGSKVERIRFKYVTTTGTTTSVACVMRVYISTKTSGATTNADTFLWDEVAIPATGAISTTVAAGTWDVPLNFALNPGYTILAKVSVSQSANCGFIGTVIASDY